MKISTKGRYALRLMIDLAVNDNGAMIPIKAISARQGISEKYLEQIINTLVKSGFVTSVRGNNGGYRLARAPKEYTAGEILRLSEGSLAPVVCLDADVNCCEKAGKCATLSLWTKIYEAVNNIIDNVTLEELAEEQRALNQPDFMI